MSDNVINIPRESTMKALMEMQKMAVAGGANPGAADLCYKYMVAQCTSKEQVDNLFIEWWKSQYDASKFTKVEMLERWFGRVLEDDRVHGVTFPLFATSSTAIGELTDDSVGLKCVPSTAKTQGQDDFAHLPQFWCLEVSAEKKTDGSHEIFYVEHIDDIKDVRSGEHLCWVLQKNTYTKEWDEDGYRYLKMKCHQSTGYELWPEGRDRTGRVYAYAARPKYYAGIGASGKITCGTGLAPVNRTSHTAGVTKWRDRGTQYSGASGKTIKFLDRMMRLKYARKGNSGTIEGCSSYNYQYTAAYSEKGVERVLLTPEQAANLFVGSSVQIGIQSGTDRNTASNYSVCKNKLITATHVYIESALRPSTLLCEQISTVSEERIGEWIGELTESEVQDLDIALAVSLGMKCGPGQLDTDTLEHLNNLQAELDRTKAELREAKSGTDYKLLYDQLIEKMLSR